MSENTRNDPLSIVGKQTATETSRLKTESIDVDRSTTTTETKCTICCLSYLSGSKIIPIITSCGHTNMCASCFDKAKQFDMGKNKLPSCSLCRVVQFGSPLQVYRVKDDLHTRLEVTLKIEYNGHFTDRNLVLQIQCFMSTTGKEIRDRANEILVQKNIHFPNTSRTVYFDTPFQHIPLHGNTTLQDVGFNVKTDTVSIHEGFIKLSSKIVQEKLLTLLPTPNDTFQLTINSASKGLNDVVFSVTKTDTLSQIARYIYVNLFERGDGRMRQLLTQIGLTLLLPEIGFKYVFRIQMEKKEIEKLEHSLTLEELKIGGLTNDLYYCFGQ